MIKPRAWWPLAAILLAYAPFLVKAFHIDDPFFLAMAERILVDWTHPYGFSYNWFGSAEPVSAISANPPFFSYWLAGAIAVAGRAEWVLHAACFPFVVLVYAGMRWLGRRFGVHPMTAALLIVATPAVMVTSHTCMPDLASLAGYLLAVAWFIRGYDHGRWPWMVAAGVAAGLAVWCRYSGLGVLVVWGWYMVLHRPRTARHLLLGAVAWAVALGMFGAWCLLSWSWDGQIHPVTTAQFIAGRLPPHPWAYVGEWVVPVLAAIGGVTIVPTAFEAILPVRGSRYRWLTYGCLGVAGAVAAWTIRVWGYTLGQGLLAAIFIWGGLAAVLVLAGRPLLRRSEMPWTERTRDQLFLAAWFWSVLISVCLPLYFPAVRRILPLLAPLILLFLQQVQGDRPRALPLIVGLTAALGLAVSTADMAQAGVYRQFVERKLHTLALPSGRTWCAGHWGFQYYMERAGFRAFDARRDALRAGDRVVLAYQPWPQVSASLDGVRERLSPGTVLTSGDGSMTILIPPVPWWPIRTVSWLGHAHFYSNRHADGSFAFLPYTVSGAPLDVFIVHRVGDQKAR